VGQRAAGADDGAVTQRVACRAVTYFWTHCGVLLGCAQNRANKTRQDDIMTEHLPPKRLEMSLEDRLTQEEGWVYMTGMQALVRLPIQQRKRDIAAGLNTGGYISGYRGSPVGTYDMNLWRAEAALKAHNIHFQPGVNVDLAATETW
jgi:hypothetical protein